MNTLSAGRTLSSFVQSLYWVLPIHIINWLTLFLFKKWLQLMVLCEISWFSFSETCAPKKFCSRKFSTMAFDCKEKSRFKNKKFVSYISQTSLTNFDFLCVLLTVEALFAFLFVCLCNQVNSLSFFMKPLKNGK